MSTTMPDLRVLRAELLTAQIRREAAEAAKAEIDLAIAEDTERDRLVKAGRVRRLDINDVIAPPKVDLWIDALNHWERRDPGEPVTITINSQGGSVTDGLALYDTIMRLRRKGHHVTTHGQGLVASMASVLLQAGDERVFDQRAKLLIHEGSTFLQGRMTRGEQEDMQKFTDLLLNDILEILSERSTLSKTQIKRKWERRDWTLTAADALKYGFVDRVE